MPRFQPMLKALALGCVIALPSCAVSGSLDVLCQRNQKAEEALTVALAEDTKDASVKAGQEYIAINAAGCGR